MPGDPLNDFLFTELGKVFERKWNNLAPDGSIETVAWRTPTLPPPTEPTTCGDPSATNYRRPAAVHVSAAATAAAAAAAGRDHHRRLSGEGRDHRRPSWQLAADPTAAGGTALWNPNANKAKVAPALAAPASYVEQTFDAMAGTAYHVWVRLRAEDDSLSNDSVHMQFSDSVTSIGSPTLRIGTSSSAEFLLQDGPSGAARQRVGLDRQRLGAAGRADLLCGDAARTPCASSSARMGRSSIRSS